MPFERVHLDRRIELQRRTTATDAFGARLETWQTFARPWAARVSTTGSESDEDIQVSAAGRVEWRMRYMAGVHAGDRVVYEGTTFDIEDIREVGGRRAYMILACRAIDPRTGGE